MAKIAVINSSHPVYNLGTSRIAHLLEAQGHEVKSSGGADLFDLEVEKAYLSAIFSWDLPALCRDANLLKSRGVEIEMGGPAVTCMPEYVKEQTGIEPHIGLDPRFEITDGKYQATFTSRGCPRACLFCAVVKIEGRHMVEYTEFPIPSGENPFVCDNNLLATSWDHQKLVVEKLKGVKNLDLNSGFDARIFMKDPEKYWNLYRGLKLECWRAAYDQEDEKESITAWTEFMHSKGVIYRSLNVYCLIGFNGSTFEDDKAKCQYLVDIGTSPYPQRYKPLDILTKSWDPPGWRKGAIELLYTYYSVANFWRSTSWEDFRSKNLGKVDSVYDSRTGIIPESNILFGEYARLNEVGK
jgi:hypothetical protein